jgi:hypothetical protein
VSALVRRAFTVDGTPPVARLSGADGAITSSSPSFTLSVNEAATFTCRPDEGEEAACGAGGVITFSGLAAGAHTLRVVATDEAGNQAEAIVRSFRVGLLPGTELPPVEQPANEPSIQVIDRATGATLTIRLADIDRRVKLEDLRQAGIQVTVILAAGTKLIRFRPFKVGNGQNRGGRAAAAARTPKERLVATVYREARAGRRTKLALDGRTLRRLAAGRYVLEATPGASKRRLGKATRRGFAVTR